MRSLVDVARGSLGGLCSDVFEEVEPLSNPFEPLFLFTGRRVHDSRVRLHVVFVSVIHPVTSAVVAVVGDGRSGEHLHGRGNKGDVYWGEVA